MDTKLATKAIVTGNRTALKKRAALVALVEK
jgi:hypothetical protein